ncbi:hypothetical protein [Methylobacterium sp. AMS5]|nr:hypothetical protein [Methylobacterium sp. AMS5]AMB48369.1 hypothetical protein Y590_25710 [Methylobacterium sp. AMS5]
MSSDVIALILGCCWFGTWGYLTRNRPRFGGWRGYHRISKR